MRKLEVNYQNMIIMMMLKARILKTGVVELVKRNPILEMEFRFRIRFTINDNYARTRNQTNYLDKITWYVLGYLNVLFNINKCFLLDYSYRTN
jgi:hypothetical protein